MLPVAAKGKTTAYRRAIASAVRRRAVLPNSSDFFEAHNMTGAYVVTGQESVHCLPEL